MVVGSKLKAGPKQDSQNRLKAGPKQDSQNRLRSPILEWGES